jgi:hypothetical protein
LLTGHKVKEGLFFDWVHVDGDGFPIDQQIKRAIDVLAHAAFAHLARLDSAKMLTNPALCYTARE